MNGRVAKSLRKVFSPEESPAKRNEFRRFKRAYRDSNKDKRAEVRAVTKRILEVKARGGEIKQVRINPETHATEEVK